MTVSCFRVVTRHRASPFFACLASLLLLASAPSRGADDPSNPNGTFNTPGYPAVSTQTYPNGSNAPVAGQGGQSTAVYPRSPQGQGSLPGQASNNGYNNPGEGTNQQLQQQQQRPLAPPPLPSEFQKFVDAATGRLLPIFGSKFFRDAGDTYTPLDNVPVSADYTIGPGDEVNIRVWGSIDVDYRSTVDRNGLLNLPKIGSFNVAGVKSADLEKNLRNQIGRLYTNFNLSVSLGQLRGVKVFVVGPALHPGVFTLSSQSTLLSAVVVAGGPAPNGSMRKVLLRRDGQVISELDIYEFLVQGDKSKDTQLIAGDVIVFQPAGPRVALTGALDTPAIYELKLAQEPVREVLRYAGGIPTLANPNLAQLERVDASQPKAARFVEKFRLDGSGLQKPLRDGDVLTLLPISPQFANAVTLRGHVAQPLRYPFTPGMRIRDLIPDRDALISPDFYRRKNLLVQALEPDDGELSDNPNDTRAGTAGGNVGTNGAGGTPGDSRDRAAGNNGRAPGYVAATGNNGREPMTRADRARRQDDRDVVQRSRRAPTALFDELNWNYAVIERLNPVDLSTEVIPFNLGRAVLQGDETNNLALQPGDVVTVYSQTDIRVPVSQQTRLVSLEGEINSPGVYQLRPGETLRALVARAGGLTPQAYLYGLEFSREETRQRQRDNLAQAITRLEALSTVQTARDAANRRDDTTAAAATAVSNAATQAQLSRLRTTQPSGRIALELEAGAKSVEDLPDIPLENADRILVPPRPGFVTVAGAVVNSNAFLWRPGRTAGDYLRLAGVDEAADPSNMFILRADGTVNHAGDRRGFFGGNSLQSQVMQPGDALIVPNQLDFETWGRAFVRNLKDFAQIFTGFGIGIAAIHSL